MSDSPATDGASLIGIDFVRQLLAAARARGEQIVTRFPPEPNGFLHIGHAKSITLNFGVAEESGGKCYLRFDDTNPLKEDISYIHAIERDIKWLGYDCAAGIRYASDYFERLYELAEELIRLGKAYVCSLSGEDIRLWRGDFKTPGRESPHRSRSVEENLDLFRRMRAGEFLDGASVLRARIDMQSPNLNMRDPVLYRIRHASHPRTGDTWRVYPTYDYAHTLSDALEGITYSLCTLEFEDHRPLYEWLLEQLGDQLPGARPQQVEFAKLMLEGTVVSKRLLGALVAEGHVDGWDDPRMPTLAGLRRRGAPPEAIREFCDRSGTTKKLHRLERQLFDFCIRDHLEKRARRAFAVLSPLRLVVQNLPADSRELLEPAWHPQNAELGQRELPFCRELFIDREDFSLDPPPGFKRLIPGGTVRLRYAYIIRLEEVELDEEGQPHTLHCSYYPDSRSGQDRSGIKAKGVIHWVPAADSIPFEARLYSPLFTEADPGSSVEEIVRYLNPESLAVCPEARMEPALAGAEPGSRWQFERLGYFCRDARLCADGRPVFNRTLTLREGWRPPNAK